MRSPVLRLEFIAGVASLLTLAVSAAAQSATSSARIFRAGGATSTITPFLGSPIGTGTSSAVHIHDELHARCLALDDGQTRLVFAVVDNVSVPREVFDEAKRLVHRATGVPAEHMMMSATHTHSGPNARGANPVDWNTPMPVPPAASAAREGAARPPLHEYQQFLAQRIADGVRRALNNLEPARIGWGSGQVPQHVFNRRWVLKDGKSVPNPFGGQDRVVTNQRTHPDRLRPAGPTNPEVYFLSVQSTDGRPIALLANYWLHYVGGVGRGHISADYFGAFGQRMKELLAGDHQDPPFVGILANGPCGDVNHLGYKPSPPRKFEPYEKIRLVANDVAQEVLRVHRSIRFHGWVELKAAQSELVLQMRRPTPDMIRRAEEVLEKPITSSPVQHREVDYARRTLAGKAWPERVSVILQAFSIGGLAITAIPFETFTETGLEIKARSPFKDTFTIELANGGYGYLPTPAQHELGGYETWLGPSRVEKEASSRIVATLLNLLSRLGDKP